MSVKHEMHGNLPVCGMWHLFVHLEGFFDIIECLDFYETSKRTQTSVEYPIWDMGSDFEVHQSVNMD